MLIESGSPTSVQFMSGSQPIPRNKLDIACAHALAAQYMGMKLVYLEAGSGAANSVPADMIEAVAGYIDIPVLTGGGIRTPAECSAKILAGASFVVVGNFFERTSDHGLLREMAAAAHPREPIHV
jgi:putative glycerol-1-phosphate prenyltransferase